jgi:hypothetical protein
VVSVGGGVRCATYPRTKDEIAASASAEFFDAVARKDLATLRKFVHQPFDYGGLWFPTPACQRVFPVGRRIGGRIKWIGFEGRRAHNDGIPTVTPASLDARLVTGERVPTTTPETNAALDAQMAELHKHALYVWFKFCVDAEGNVTSVRARDTESPLLVKAYTPTLQAWKFQPFKLGTQASPVCALQEFLYPKGAYVKRAEELPLPDAMGNDDALLHVSHEITHRIAGSPAIQPDPAEKQRLAEAGQTHVEGAVEFCIDEQGSVFQTMLVEPTGLPNYDKKIVDSVKTWRYQPVLIAGVATRVCTGLTLVYQQ